jgi:pyruvate formate lyase activating enzyme
MRIGGFQRFSLIDYPGRVSAVVFAQGCNFRCPYCHNCELIDERPPRIPDKEILAFLEHRRGFLDGVVVTGGEALRQDETVGFLEKLKVMGYPVKLDTNGSKPSMIDGLLKAGLVDYIAADYKAPLRKYGMAAGCEVDISAIRRSVEIIANSGVEYEIRTTVFRGLSADDIIEAMDELHDLKVMSYYLQMFVNSPGCRSDLSVPDMDVEYLQGHLRRRFSKYGIRNIGQTSA